MDHHGKTLVGLHRRQHLCGAGLVAGGEHMGDGEVKAGAVGPLRVRQHHGDALRGEVVGGGHGPGLAAVRAVKQRHVKDLHACRGAGAQLLFNGQLHHVRDLFGGVQRRVAGQRRGYFHRTGLDQTVGGAVGRGGRGQLLCGGDGAGDHRRGGGQRVAAVGQRRACHRDGDGSAALVGAVQRAGQGPAGKARVVPRQHTAHGQRARDGDGRAAVKRLLRLQRRGVPRQCRRRHGGVDAHLGGGKLGVAAVRGDDAVGAACERRAVQRHGHGVRDVLFRELVGVVHGVQIEGDGAGERFVAGEIDLPLGHGGGVGHAVAVGDAGGLVRCERHVHGVLGCDVHGGAAVGGGFIVGSAGVGSGEHRLAGGALRDLIGGREGVAAHAVQRRLEDEALRRGDGQALQAGLRRAADGRGHGAVQRRDGDGDLLARHDSGGGRRVENACRLVHLQRAGYKGRGVVGGDGRAERALGDGVRARVLPGGPGKGAGDGRRRVGAQEAGKAPGQRRVSRAVGLFRAVGGEGQHGGGDGKGHADGAGIVAGGKGGHGGGGGAGVEIAAVRHGVVPRLEERAVGDGDVGGKRGAGVGHRGDGSGGDGAHASLHDVEGGDAVVNGGVVAQGDFGGVAACLRGLGGAFVIDAAVVGALVHNGSRAGAGGLGVLGIAQRRTVDPVALAHGQILCELGDPGGVQRAGADAGIVAVRGGEGVGYVRRRARGEHAQRLLDRRVGGGAVVAVSIGAGHRFRADAGNGGLGEGAGAGVKADIDVRPAGGDVKGHHGAGDAGGQDHVVACRLRAGGGDGDMAQRLAAADGGSVHLDGGGGGHLIAGKHQIGAVDGHADGGGGGAVPGGDGVVQNARDGLGRDGERHVSRDEGYPVSVRRKGDGAGVGRAQRGDAVGRAAPGTGHGVVLVVFHGAARDNGGRHGVLAVDNGDGGRLGHGGGHEAGGKRADAVDIQPFRHAAGRPHGVGVGRHHRVSLVRQQAVHGDGIGAVGVFHGLDAVFHRLGGGAGGRVVGLLEPHINVAKAHLMCPV